jgi:hypothetical protein
LLIFVPIPEQLKKATGNRPRSYSSTGASAERLEADATPQRVKLFQMWNLVVQIAFSQFKTTAKLAGFGRFRDVSAVMQSRIRCPSRCRFLSFSSSGHGPTSTGTSLQPPSGGLVIR